MKQVKVKSSSVPAMAITVVIALCVGAFVYLGNGKNRPALIADADKFLFPHISGDTRGLAKVLPAAAMTGGTGMDTGKVAQWIKPSIASLYYTKTIIEPAPVNQPNAATFSRPNETQVIRKLGSGVVVHPSGLILTNNHIVESADRILVKISGLQNAAEAKVVMVDPKSDLCLLKIDTEYPLPVAAIHRANHLMTGEPVIAVSVNPDMTTGARRTMVSSVGRTVMVNGSAHSDLVSLDRKLGPSFNGGPLVDANGYVAGIVSPIDTKGKGGLNGFAISTKTIHRFLARSMERAETPTLVNFTVPIAAAPLQAGLVREAPLRTESNGPYWIGANFQNLEPALAKQYGSPFPQGAMVNYIHPGGPATGSGIQPGDIVLKANGRLVRGAGDIEAVVKKSRGHAVRLQIFRKGERMEITIPTAKNPTLGGAAVAMTANAMVPQNNVGGAAPRVDMDRMMANNKRQMIVDKFGLDPALAGMRMDNDRLMRMAREQMVAEKLGLDLSSLKGPGAGLNRAVRDMLRRDMAIRLGLDANAAAVMGRDQMAQMAQNSLLAESLNVPVELAQTPGVTRDEIVRTAVDNYIGGKLNIPAGEVRNFKAPPKTRNAAAAQGQGAPDRDRIAREQLNRDLAAKLALDPNLLAIAGMGPDRLIKIAGDHYLVNILGLDPAMLTMPGFDRDRAITIAANNRLARKLSVPARLRNNVRVTTDQILKAAENRILANRLGLPLTVLDTPGMNRGRLLRIAGDRLVSVAWNAGAN